MYWLLILLVFFIALACILSLLPLQLEIDSDRLSAVISWKYIAVVILRFDKEWLMTVRVLFFRKTIPLASMRKIKKTAKKPTGNKKTNTPSLKKIMNMIKAFRMEEWKLALDSGDYALNAQLYPLNFLPVFYPNLNINFMDEQYIYIRISSPPWKLLIAFLR